MNKQEVIKYLEKKREAALENIEYYHENEKYETMNRVRVDSYTIAIQAVEKMEEAEKVEVPEFVAEWYEVNKGNLEFNIASAFHRIGRNTHNPQHSIYEWLNDSNNEPMQTLFKMKDGYTVKQEPKWVVKSKDHIGLESFVNWTVKPMWTTEEPLWMTITDKSKAEAVATLVYGSVEEV